METSMVKGLITKDLWADNSYLSENIQSFQTENNGNPGPRRLWEIDDFFKCTVIGTCLDMTEQKRFLKKGGFSIKKMSSFEIHEIMVNSSEGENSLSRRIDSWLNRKFKREITSFCIFSISRGVAHGFPLSRESSMFLCKGTYPYLLRCYSLCNYPYANPDKTCPCKPGHILRGYPVR